MDPVPIGVIFLVVMVILLLLSFNIDKLPFTSGTGYSAAFARADGLRKGDRVMVGGVVVGKVTSVGLEGTHVRVGFSITNGDAHLGQDSTASIQIATLLGNKYVALDPRGPGAWPSSHDNGSDRHHAARRRPRHDGAHLPGLAAFGQIHADRTLAAIRNDCLSRPAAR
jgi:ABC-type transporter Mla subunit MlaD